MNLDLDDKRVLITGASKGIGFAWGFLHSTLILAGATCAPVGVL